MATPIAARMSRRPIQVSASASTAEARRIAEDNGVHHLLVEQDDGLVGVVCLCNLDAARPLDSVESCMKIPAFVSVSSTVEDAAETMRLCGIGCLPVVDDEGRLVGIVTRHDVIETERDSGALSMGRCAACGSSSVAASGDRAVAFCASCFEQVKRDPYDDIYFVVGGGD